MTAMHRVALMRAGVIWNQEVPLRYGAARAADPQVHSLPGNRR